MGKPTKADNLEALQTQEKEINGIIGSNKVNVEYGEYNFFDIAYGDKKYIGEYYDVKKFLSFVKIGAELKASTND